MAWALAAGEAGPLVHPQAGPPPPLLGPRCSQAPWGAQRSQAETSETDGSLGMVQLYPSSQAGTQTLHWTHGQRRHGREHDRQWQRKHIKKTSAWPNQVAEHSG